MIFDEIKLIISQLKFPKRKNEKTRRNWEIM